MEESTQITYNGYRASYKITTLNSTFYNAELIEFSGMNTEFPPSSINFIKINERLIANSDSINIAKDLLKQMGLKSLHISDAPTILK